MSIWTTVQKNLKNPYILLAIIALVTLLFITKQKEGFGSTSPGTMVQLQTSHVPTEEDEYYWKNIYPKIVRKEIYDLTESDLH
jgi:hypothetical protein